MISPFADNTTYQIQYEDPNRRLLTIGYVFSSPGTVKGVAQEQRWVLYRGYCPLPLGRVRLVPPAASMQYSSLNAWIEAMRAGASGQLWQEGATYVKVYAANHDALAEPLQEPPEMPALNALSMVDNTSGASEGWASDHRTQLIDEMLAVVYRIDSEEKENAQGYGFGTASSLGFDPRVSYNFEYWLTMPGYISQIQGDIARLDISVSKNKGVPLEDMLSGFVPGATLAIASCAYLSELPANP